MRASTADRVEVGHIMWQPMTACALRCHDCYLSAFREEHPTDDDQGRGSLLSLIYTHKLIKCNQLTLSLNTVREVPRWLQVGLQRLWKNHNKHSGSDPLLAITAHDLRTLDFWAQALELPDLAALLQPLGVLSLSVFPYHPDDIVRLKQACLTHGVTLNYNRVASEDIAHTEQFAIGCKVADSIHVVLNKQPLGAKQPTADLYQWHQAVNLARRFPLIRVVQDLCVRESERYLDEGKTCSACYGRLHVWPDESVTGCPYDARHICTAPVTRATDRMASAQLLERILAVVQTTKDYHPIRHCGIPETIKKLRG